MPFTEAQHRYTTARGYIQAVKMIQSSPLLPGKEIAVTLSTHLLAAFAIELYLKAWLLQAGHSSPSVRSFGHDINRLIQEARQNGLPQIPRLDQVIDIFAKPHRELAYRYLDEGVDIAIANWPVTCAILDELDTAIDTFTGASVSQGRRPGFP